MNPSLPQDDPNPAARTAQLQMARRQYQFDFTLLKSLPNQPGYPMVQSVPLADQSFTKWKWTHDVVSIVLRILANQSMYDVAIEGGFAVRLLTYIRLSRLLHRLDQRSLLEKLFYLLLPVIERVLAFFGRAPQSVNLEKDVAQNNSSRVEARLRSMVKEVQKADPPSGESTTFRAYQDLFQIIYLPCISARVQDDRLFSAQRVAGANPLMLERISTLPSHFPVTNAQYQAIMGNDDDLDRAGTEGRLYLADYQVLEDIQTLKVSTEQKYLCAPLALFAIASGDYPGRLLNPIAIQCNPQPGPNNPIFVPPAHDAPDSVHWAWQIAKTIVQIADGNYHELISHLGRTHLLIEPIAISTERQLAANHPLGILLRPHLEGTLFINDLALKGLINLGGTVDQVLAGSLESSLLLSVKGAKGFPWPFNESMLPLTLAKRGVDDPDQLPDYPYRDDALLIWQAIQTWVNAYLHLYYATDTDVAADAELQAWLTELVAEDGGQMTGIGEHATPGAPPQILTLNYLIEAVTLIIFTCSAQHAAVNFPQASLMTYAPNMPLAGYRPAPTSTSGLSKADYFNLLPSLSKAETQMTMTYALGSVYYTTLGQYDPNHFQDPRVVQPLTVFQTQLKDIEIEIQSRNQTRPTYYDSLLPSKIPQSTNI